MGSTEGPEYTPEELFRFDEERRKRREKIIALGWYLVGLICGVVLAFLGLLVVAPKIH